MEGGILVLVVVVMLVVESILVLVVEGHTLRPTGPLLLKPLQLESAASQGGGEEDGEDPGEHQWSAWSTACDHIGAVPVLHNSLLVINHMGWGWLEVDSDNAEVE